MGRSKRATSQQRRPIYEVGSYYGPPNRSVHLRHRRVRPSNAWVWGCALLGSLMCVGMCIFTLLLTPLALRLLPENIQAGLVRRVPALAGLMPATATSETALEFVPTIDPARATAAAAIFSTPGIAVTPTPVLGQNLLNRTQPPLVGATLIPTLTPTLRPTQTSEPLPATFYIPNRVAREPQTWNNCGPANLVQGMRVLGVGLSQKDAANWLKPNDKDANVSPWQLAAYTNQFTQMRALVRVNGTFDLLKRLIYYGYGVVLETGLYHPEDGQWLGHYVTVVGWDDYGTNERGGFFYGLDSFESNGPDGKGAREFYADLDERWKHFNRVYMVLYRPDQERKLRDILGTAFEETTNLQEALARAFNETKINPHDPFAWFNVGTNYVMLGQYELAARAYDTSRAVGRGWPWRMLWYQFGPYKAYYKVGDYKTVIDLANAVIGRSKYIEETFYYRGLAYAASGLADQAMADLQYAARFNPNFYPAVVALSQLQSGVQPVPETL